MGWGARGGGCQDPPLPWTCLGAWREAELGLTGFFLEKYYPVRNAGGGFCPRKTSLPNHTRAQSRAALHFISIDRGCRPTAAPSTSQQTGWLPPPKSPVHLCKGACPLLHNHFLPLISFPASTLHHFDFSLKVPLFFLPASREGEAPWSRMHQLSSAWRDLAGLLATLRASHGTSGTSAFHHLPAGFGCSGGAQEVGHEIKLPGERRGAGHVPVSEPAPAQRVQPAAFPVFHTLHLSPMRGRSPAWKPADSFQSCKMKLFHPKDRGCSARCPPASLNSDQISR